MAQNNDSCCSTAWSLKDHEYWRGYVSFKNQSLFWHDACFVCEHMLFPPSMGKGTFLHRQPILILIRTRALIVFLSLGSKEPHKSGDSLNLQEQASSTHLHSVTYRECLLADKLTWKGRRFQTYCAGQLALNTNIQKEEEVCNGSWVQPLRLK